MSAVDEKQIPAGTARTLHPGCVWGTWVELCGTGSAEFISQVQLGLLILSNFSWSCLIYLGMWLHSALRNKSFITVTWIPHFLFSHIKNREEKIQLLLAEHSACVPCHQGTTPTPSFQPLGAGYAWAHRVDILARGFRAVTQVPWARRQVFLSCFAILCGQRRRWWLWILHSFRYALALNRSLEDSFLKYTVFMVLATVNYS